MGKRFVGLRDQGGLALSQVPSPVDTIGRDTSYVSVTQSALST